MKPEELAATILPDLQKVAERNKPKVKAMLPLGLGWAFALVWPFLVKVFVPFLAEWMSQLIIGKLLPRLKPLLIEVLDRLLGASPLAASVGAQTDISPAEAIKALLEVDLTKFDREVLAVLKERGDDVPHGGGNIYWPA